MNNKGEQYWRIPPRPLPVSLLPCQSAISPGFDFDPATPLAASGAAAVAEMSTSPITGADLSRNLPLPVLW